ncbi:MAG: homoserine dehydrogenase [Thermoleophilia bacterium]
MRVQSVVNVALLGYGTIGSSVYALLERERDQIIEATGVELRVRRILEKDVSFERPGVPRGLFTDDFDSILADPEVNVVVEVIGGTKAAFEFVEAALRAGKDVVTANKQLLANRGAPLFELAKDLGRQIRFEASVGGAIPIIKVMRESMIAAEIHSVYGIVNGTTNYVLTSMYRGEGNYADALAKAQELGYAEPDPTEDVNGADAAAKMAILASIAYKSRVTMQDVTYEGIEHVTLEDVQYARDFGFVVKLIGAARLIDGRINARVFPALVSDGHPLASINGSTNAVFLQGDVIDEIMLTGPGAGGRQTASAVVSDIVSIASTKTTGFLQNCSCYRNLDFIPAGEVESAFFIRMQVEDRAGVLAQIAGCFGEENVSIESMIQKGHGDEAELVIITHPTREEGFMRAVESISELSVVRGRPTSMRVL